MSHLYDLTVLISDRQVAYALYNPRDKYFAVLKSQAIYDPNDFKTFVNLEFNLPFKSIKILLANQYTTLYPDTLFDKTKIETSLAFSHPFQPLQEDVFTDNIKSNGLVNIYKTTKLLRELLNTYFANYRLMHYSSTFVEGLALQHLEGEHLFVYIHDDFIHVMQYSEGKIKFFNSFEFEVHEDILYYILAVYEQTGLNPKNQALTVYGDCNRFSELFDLLKKYIYEVQLGKRPENFQYHLPFDNLPEHLFFPLFSSPLCE
jgi:hypothetical protein